MKASQIKTMTADECHKAMSIIEDRARWAGKELTATQKKTIKALEQRAAEIGSQFEEE